MQDKDDLPGEYSHDMVMLSASSASDDQTREHMLGISLFVHLAGS